MKPTRRANERYLSKLRVRTMENQLKVLQRTRDSLKSHVGFNPFIIEDLDERILGLSLRLSEMVLMQEVSETKDEELLHKNDGRSSR